MPLLQSLLRPGSASLPPRWTKLTVTPRIHTSCSYKVGYQAPSSLSSFKPSPRRFSQLQQASYLARGLPPGSIRPKISFRSRVSSFAAGAALTVFMLSGSMYLYYRSFFGKVPITNRERMLWFDRNYEEEVGWQAESWLLSQQNARPRLEEESVIVKLVRDILVKLLETELGKGVKLKLYVVDDYLEPCACSVPALEGGRIFINTGELYVCENADEIAGVMAHELSHIIARHIPERRAAEAFARTIAQFFGWNAALGYDMISWRAQEREADHIGLILMAQGGFDPKARVEYFERRHSKEKEQLNGRDPMPETMSTHPSHENRAKTLKSILPEANAIFEKSPNAARSMNETWEAARVILVDGMQATVAQIEAAQQMAPEMLLQRIEARMEMLVNALENISAAISVKDKSNEDILDISFAAAARRHKGLEALEEPRREEGVIEQRIAEGGIVKEAVPKEAVHATPKGFLGLKEAATQATRTANASRPPVEEKHENGGQGEEKT